MIKKILSVAKAIAATVVPAISVALVENHLDWKPLVAAAASAALVYFVPNAKPEAALIQEMFSPVSAGNPDPETSVSVPPVPQQAPPIIPTPPVQP